MCVIFIETENNEIDEQNLGDELIYVLTYLDYLFSTNKIQVHLPVGSHA